MTRLDRPLPAPDVLLVEGATQTALDCAAHERGEREFTFRSDIYGAPAVKNLLQTMHGNRCAWCECEVHDHPGNIDHFRPMARSQQAKGDPYLQPGYYWLAYVWENLLFTCHNCNQYFKRSFFPLANPAGRSRSHQEPLQIEEPLLINPAEEDPAPLVRYRGELVEAVNGNLRGRVTIGVFKLNEREPLVGNRRKRLQIFLAMRRLIALLPGTQDALDAEELLAREMGPSGEYRAMLLAASTVG